MKNYQFNYFICNFLLFIFIAFSLFPFAYAHQRKIVLTAIEINDQEGVIYISRRFFIHDLEHEYKQYMKEDNLNDDLELRRVIARELYTHNFEIEEYNRDDNKNGKKEKEEITILGTEVDFPYIWLYYEKKFDKKFFQSRLEKGNSIIPIYCQVFFENSAFLEKFEHLVTVKMKNTKKTFQCDSKRSYFYFDLDLVLDQK